MAVVTGPVHDERTLWRGFGLGAIAAVVVIAALAALVNLAADDGDTVRGSGVEVTDERQAFHELPLNGVCLAPGEYLMPAGNASMRHAYEAAGVAVQTVDISELIKAGGGIHCMTAFLKRDEL